MSTVESQFAGGSPREKAALDELERSTEELIPRIAEQFFVSRYLPLFASQEADVDLTSWLDVCGNAYIPVDVVSGNEVLFRVPALIRQMPTATTRRGRESVYEMMETANKKSQINPNLGRAYLERQIDHRINRLGVDASEVETWNSIFTRYGYPPIMEVSGGETVKVEKEKEDLFEDGFEEL